MLELTESIEDLGVICWQLVLTLMLAWVCINHSLIVYFRRHVLELTADREYRRSGCDSLAARVNSHVYLSLC